LKTTLRGPKRFLYYTGMPLFSLIKTVSYDMYILHTQHRPNKIHIHHICTQALTYTHTQHTQKKSKNKIMYLFIYHMHILLEISFQKQGSIIYPVAWHWSPNKDSLWCYLMHVAMHNPILFSCVQCPALDK
jgi:hypothetical protein